MRDLLNNKNTETTSEVISKSANFYCSKTSEESNQGIEKDVDYKRERSTRGQEFGIFPQGRNYDQQEFDQLKRRNSGDRINSNHNGQVVEHSGKRGMNDVRPNGAILATPPIPPLIGLLSANRPLHPHHFFTPIYNRPMIANNDLQTNGIVLLNNQNKQQRARAPQHACIPFWNDGKCSRTTCKFNHIPYMDHQVKSSHFLIWRKKLGLYYCDYFKDKAMHK